VSFLPEDDQDYLQAKGFAFEERSERPPEGSGERRGILFPAFTFAGNLNTSIDGRLQPCSSCDLLVLIPSGYATTKLDSFYTSPRLKRADGADPDRATGEADLFSRKWQFWSRHLEDHEWRAGQDGLETFLNYIRAELRKA